jgi:type II secretion system protein N
MKGPSLGRRLLVTAGYSTFFLFAFVLFVYATLPLDSVRAFMVRKAADEYGADLEITDLSTWGLSGLKAEGVTVRFRPSPEEQAALEAAREARKAWDAAHAGGKKAAASPAGDGDKPAPGGAESAAKAGAEPIAGDVDDERDPEGAEKRKLEAAAGAPPSVPPGPLPVTIESLKAKVGLLALLRGAKAGAVEASLAGGTLEAELDHGGDAYHLTGKWDALDLRQFAFLRRKFDLPLAGTLAGEVDVEVPTTDTGKPRIPSATGHVALKVADAAIGPGKLALKSGGFDSVDVPLTRIAGIDGKFVLEKKKATIDHFDITGKDIEGELTGYVELKDAWAKMGPRAHLRFKLTDEFLEAHKDIKVLVTSLPKLKSATSEGYIGLLINGTMADPKITPRKDSPYKAGAKAAPGDARKTSSKERKPAKPGKAGATTTPGGGIGKLPSGATPTTSKAIKDLPSPAVVEPATPEPEGPTAAEPAPEVAAPEPVAEEPEAPAPAEPEPAAEAPETPPEAAAGGSNENPEAPADPGSEGAPEE